ncbi:MAG: hypothetical protein IV105_17630 [Rhizobacter sp.]|nr:hypothetical protein [Rhizobacter sp.]
MTVQSKFETLRASKQLGANMQRSFALTTRQAARLRGVEPHQPYSHFKRKGHWKGVVPSKLPNGRLLWNRDDILRAEGLVPADGPQPVDVRVWLAFIEEIGLPVEDRDVRTGVALLTEQVDTKRNPAHMVDEFELSAQFARGLMARFTQVESNLSEADRRRADDLRRFIAETVLKGLRDESL